MADHSGVIYGLLRSDKWVDKVVVGMGLLLRKFFKLGETNECIKLWDSTSVSFLKYLNKNCFNEIV